MIFPQFGPPLNSYPLSSLPPLECYLPFEFTPVFNTVLRLIHPPLRQYPNWGTPDERFYVDWPDPGQCG